MMSHRALQGVALGLAVAATAGCARNDSRDAAEPQFSSAHLSLTFTRIGRGDGLRFEAQGHFVRFAASDGDHVSAILGLPDDESVPLDSCRLVDSAEALDRALSAARATLPVKLLDAGRLQVRGPVDATMLAPRHYPELTPYVAGVVYGNEDTLPLALEPGAAYEIAGEGGEDVGPFQAQVVAPRQFPTLEVPAYRRGGDLELRWAEAGEPSPPLVLTVSWSARGASREVRCRVRDDGSFTIGRELLAQVPPPSQLLTADVAALRTRVSTVSAPGTGKGELRLGLRDAVPLPVSPWSPGQAAPPEER